MTTMDPVLPGRGLVSSDELVADRRLDGLSTFLHMLGRVVAPGGAWSDHSSQAEAAMLDVLRVTAAAMPHATAVSITQTGGSGKSRTVVATDHDGLSADALQHAARQGPSVAAIDTEQTVTTGDVRCDGRWPQLTAIAEHVSVRSVISVPLANPGLPHAALNVYSDMPGVFSDETASSGLPGAVLAGACMALGALQRQHRIDNLQVALESNRAIGAAIGIVMTRHQCTSDEAFARITQVSQNRNIKLRTVADDIMRAGLLPGAEGHSAPDGVSRVDLSTSDMSRGTTRPPTSVSQ